MEPEDLTLISIDGMRHLTTSEEVVRAVAFAVRAGHENHTAYRFVSAVAMLGALTDRSHWPAILLRVMDLERAAEEETG
jgi:hypothetical protein